MKMKKIISLLFIICTILVVAGCGSSKSKFEGTWYGVDKSNAYKVEITKNDKNKHLIKIYYGNFEVVSRDIKNAIKTDKWKGFNFDKQYIGNLENENTIIIDRKIRKEILTINEANQIEGFKPNIKLISSKQINEKEILEKVKENRQNYNRQWKYETRFTE